MTTTLTVGLVSLAAATTVYVWEPAGEPATPPDPTVSLPLVQPPTAEPGILPAVAPVAENERADATPLVPRSPLELQEEQEADENKWIAEFNHSMAPFATTESISLNTGSGDIEIVAAPDGLVSFDAKVTADLRRVDQQDLTYNLADHIEITEEDGKLTIEDAHEGRGWSVDFVLRVPRELTLKANTGSGDVTVRQIESEVMVNTGSGDVNIQGPGLVITTKLVTNTGSGDVHIDIGGVTEALLSNTGSGDVHAQIRNFDSTGKVQLNSGSGDLTLTVPANIAGELDLETDNGSISLPDSFGIQVEEGKGSTKARGMIGGGGALYKLRSGSGDIAVTTGKKRVGPQ